MQNYTVKLVNPAFILLEDTNVGMSITNSAERVVAEILNLEGFSGQQIFYVDTQGCVDELVHDGKKFIGFNIGFDTVDEFESAML